MRKYILVLSILFNLFLAGTVYKMIQTLGGINYVLFKIRNRGTSGTYDHRIDLFKQLKKGSDEIVFLGNSIIQQGEWHELLENPLVKNRGISGDVAEGIFNRLDDILPAQPSKIFLMLGINDLLFKGQKNLHEFYPKILKKIQEDSPSTQIFIHSILPINNQLRKINLPPGKIIESNRFLKELATEFHVSYIDIHTPFKNESGLLNANFSRDGIHLNGKGYVFWAEMLKGYL